MGLARADVENITTTMTHWFTNAPDDDLPLDDGTQPPKEPIAAGTTIPTDRIDVRAVRSHAVIARYAPL